MLRQGKTVNFRLSPEEESQLRGSATVISIDNAQAPLRLNSLKIQQSSGGVLLEKKSPAKSSFYENKNNIDRSQKKTSGSNLASQKQMQVPLRRSTSRHVSSRSIGINQRLHRRPRKTSSKTKKLVQPSYLLLTNVGNPVFSRPLSPDLVSNERKAVPGYDLKELFDTQPLFAEPMMQFEASNSSPSLLEAKGSSKFEKLNLQKVSKISQTTAKKKRVATNSFHPYSNDYTDLRGRVKAEPVDFANCPVTKKAHANWQVVTHTISYPDAKNSKFFWNNLQQLGKKSIYELGNGFPLQYRKVNHDQLEEMEANYQLEASKKQAHESKKIRRLQSYAPIEESTTEDVQLPALSSATKKNEPPKKSLSCENVSSSQIEKRFKEVVMISQKEPSIFQLVGKEESQNQSPTSCSLSSSLVKTSSISQSRENSQSARKKLMKIVCEDLDPEEKARRRLSKKRRPSFVKKGLGSSTLSVARRESSSRKSSYDRKERSTSRKRVPPFNHRPQQVQAISPASNDYSIAQNRGLSGVAGTLLCSKNDAKVDEARQKVQFQTMEEFGTSMPGTSLNQDIRCCSIDRNPPVEDGLPSSSWAPNLQSGAETNLHSSLRGKQIEALNDCAPMTESTTIRQTCATTFTSYAQRTRASEAPETVYGSQPTTERPINQDLAPKQNGHHRRVLAEIQRNNFIIARCRNQQQQSLVGQLKKASESRPGSGMFRTWKRNTSIQFTQNQQKEESMDQQSFNDWITKTTFVHSKRYPITEVPSVDASPSRLEAEPSSEESLRSSMVRLRSPKQGTLVKKKKTWMGIYGEVEALNRNLKSLKSRVRKIQNQRNQRQQLGGPF